MKKILVLLTTIVLVQTALAQSPVGKWKRISYTSMYEGKTMDTHAALLSQRPCAAGIVYEIFADGKYRLDASASGCDEKYKSIQEKLWSKTNWKLEGNKFTTSTLKDFAVGNTYTISFSGNKMTWKNEYDTIVYQRL
jgi:hypothetical protein